MKILNIKGIIILVAILIVFQLAVGMVISPMLSSVIIENINKYGGTKISVGKVNVWPLTLSCSIKDLKVFDPDNEKQRIAAVKAASLRISPLALLSKRLVITALNIAGAEITLKGEPDGSFNVQKLAKSPETRKQEPKPSLLDRFRGKKDWFSRIWDMLKKTSSKEASEKKAAEAKESKKVVKDVVQLPRGRRVMFSRPGQHVFQIKSMNIRDARVNVVTDTGETVEVDNAAVTLKGLGLDPNKGAAFDGLSIKGTLKKADKVAGRFDFDYAQSFRGDTQRTSCDLSAEDIDLTAVKFIYQSSLPVDFTKGDISIRSNTSIVNGQLDSRNNIVLKNQNVVPARGKQATLGIIPLPMICEALNQVDPTKLKFHITGTMEKPELKDFQETLMTLIKPYVTNLQGQLEKKATSALSGFLGKDSGEEAAAAEGGTEGEDMKTKAVESIKSFFGGAEEESK